MQTVAKLAAEQDGVFTRRRARELGVSRRALDRRLRDADWVEPMPGVLVIAGSPPSWRQQLRIATLARKGTVASHRTAARLHRMDGFDTAPVEVLLARRRLARVGDAIPHRSVRYEPIDLTEVDGIPVTTIARTLCDLGAVVSRDLVEQALDSMLRRGVSQKWIERTLRRVDRPGPSGTRVLRAILDDPRRKGKVPDSWFERLISRMVSGPEFPPLERLYDVRDDDGRLIGEIDVAFPLVKVGVEGHSDVWHFGPRRGRRDQFRDRRLSVEGFEMVYVGWDDVMRGVEPTIADIKAICDRRAYELGVSWAATGI